MLVDEMSLTYKTEINNTLQKTKKLDEVVETSKGFFGIINGYKLTNK